MGKKNKDINGSNLAERQEKNRPYIRAIRAIMSRKRVKEVDFDPADYDYPEEDIPHLKLGRRTPARVMSVWAPSAHEDGIGVMAICDDVRRVVITASDDEDFEALYFGVYDSLFDMQEDRLEAKEWLDHCNVEFIRNGVAVTVDALDRVTGRFLSEEEPASCWLGVLWHVDDEKLAGRHAEPGEEIRVVDELGNATVALAEQIIPYRSFSALPEFEWTGEKGLVAEKATARQRALAGQFVTMVTTAIAPKYVPFHIALSGKEACIEYHPAGDPDGKSVASYRHWQEPETGMKGEDAYYDGDHVPREYCKGTLDDWFGKEPGENTSPEHVLYYLLKRFGVCVDVLDSACVYSGGPYESDAEDLPFPVIPVWSLVENAELSSSPLNQRIRHLSCRFDGELDVFTRTDLDDLSGKKDVCQVFLSLADFAAGVPDAEFPDGEQNFEKFCDIIDKAYGKAQDEHDGNKEGHLKRLFHEHVRAMMSECFPSEDDFDEI